MTIRVLIVEDSLTVRRHLVEVLAADPGIEVVGEAGDGGRAIELCAKLRPDVVTLDMILPTMTGLAATEQIMAYCPTPILIVSASLNRGELFKTYEALAAGALDVLDKPSGEEPSEAWDARFVAAVKLISRLQVITHPRARLAAIGRAGRADMVSPRQQNGGFRIVAIGGSTGAPGAVVDILRGLGPKFDLPVLLVVHINEPFGRAFAEWLDGLSPLRVRYAVDGEPVPSAGEPRVVMAPPGWHLRVDEHRLRLTQEAERHSCRPSVDVLFESLAASGRGATAMACLLTGMGKDGARGLLDIRQAGGLTLAQDEASSVVFGMAREAIMLGAAVRTLALADIAPALVDAAASNRRAP